MACGRPGARPQGGQTDILDAPTMGPRHATTQCVCRSVLDAMPSLPLPVVTLVCACARHTPTLWATTHNTQPTTRTQDVGQDTQPGGQQPRLGTQAQQPGQGAAAHDAAEPDTQGGEGPDALRGAACTTQAAERH